MALIFKLKTGALPASSQPAAQLTALVAPGVVKKVPMVIHKGQVRAYAGSESGTVTGRASGLEINSPNTPKSPAVVDEDMSQRQKDALSAVGLYEAPAPAAMVLPKPGGTTIKKPSCGTFSTGSLIRIANDLFPWVAAWKVGDSGTVTRVWPAPHGTEDKDRERFMLYEIKLDAPRVSDQPVVSLRGWEIKEAV